MAELTEKLKLGRDFLCSGLCVMLLELSGLWETEGAPSPGDIFR